MLSTIDLHGCSQSEAKVKLDHFFKGSSVLVKRGHCDPWIFFFYSFKLR